MAGVERWSDPVDGPAEPDAVDAVDGADGVDGGVEEALHLLEGLEDRPVAEHVEVLDAVHGALRDRLADVGR
ncbi:hypothetical protein [Cellulomonas endophytica]|uniref:hypothetical protein n=1 Tax=Cellulomonas endophytica TaxID=2494735 RepID=UPI00101108DB|nr:hypothetical protein [Cellulomonas endophytica]